MHDFARLACCRICIKQRPRNSAAAVLFGSLRDFHRRERPAALQKNNRFASLNRSSPTWYAHRLMAAPPGSRLHGSQPANCGLHPCSAGVGGTQHGHVRSLDDMGVNHRCRNLFVSIRKNQRPAGPQDSRRAFSLVLACSSVVRRRSTCVVTAKGMSFLSSCKMSLKTEVHAETRSRGGG